MTDLERKCDHLTRHNSFTAGALWLGRQIEALIVHGPTRAALADILDDLSNAAQAHADDAERKMDAKLTASLPEMIADATK